MVNFFFQKKKKFRQTSQNRRFPILRPNLRRLSGIKISFSQNLTYSCSFLGWNLPGITMSSESLHNYFGIVVKTRKNVEKNRFFRLLSVIPKLCWNNRDIAVISSEFHPKKHYDHLLFQKKKKFRQTSQNGRFPILTTNLKPLSGIAIFFSQNLTFSYSSLGWNLPGITMLLESLHNYFGITVKSRKNDGKFFFLNFDCDPEIMLKWLQHYGNLR